MPLLTLDCTLFCIFDLYHHINFLLCNLKYDYKDEKELVDKISTTDAAVIMKVGQNLDKIRAAITLAERESDAFIVEFAAMYP